MRKVTPRPRWATSESNTLIGEGQRAIALRNVCRGRLEDPSCDSANEAGDKQVLPDRSGHQSFVCHSSNSTRTLPPDRRRRCKSFQSGTLHSQRQRGLGRAQIRLTFRAKPRSPQRSSNVPSCLSSWHPLRQACRSIPFLPGLARWLRIDAQASMNLLGSSQTASRAILCPWADAEATL